MKVTRKQILQAIRTEPLKAGNWIHSKGDTDPYLNIVDKTCKVCAVGAVLRTAGVPDIQIRSYGFGINNSDRAISHKGDEKLELEYKNYLAALSIKFEKLARKLGAGKRTRDQLANFVKKNFPKTITF